MSFNPLNGLVCAVLPEVLDDDSILTSGTFPTYNGDGYSGITSELLNSATYDGSKINISHENKSAIKVNKKIGSPSAFSFCVWLENNGQAPLSDVVSVQSPTIDSIQLLSKNDYFNNINWNIEVYDDKALVGTIGDGQLLEYSLSGSTVIKESFGLNRESIRSEYLGDDYYAIVEPSFGIFIYQKANNEYILKNQYEFNQVGEVIYDGDNDRLWALSELGLRLYSVDVNYDLSLLAETTFQKSNGNNLQIFENNSNRIWVPLFNDGFSVFEYDGVSTITEIASNSTVCLNVAKFEGDDTKVWVCSNNAGLHVAEFNGVDTITILASITGFAQQGGILSGSKLWVTRLMNGVSVVDFDGTNINIEASTYDGSYPLDVKRFSSDPNKAWVFFVNQTETTSYKVGWVEYNGVDTITFNDQDTITYENQYKSAISKDGDLYWVTGPNGAFLFDVNSFGEEKLLTSIELDVKPNIITSDISNNYRVWVTGVGSANKFYYLEYDPNTSSINLLASEIGSDIDYVYSHKSLADHCWVGYDGLKLYKYDELTESIILVASISSSDATVTSISTNFTNPNRAWVFSSGRGVDLYEYDGVSIITRLALYSFTSEIERGVSVFLDNSNRAWVCTRESIRVIEYDGASTITSLDSLPYLCEDIVSRGNSEAWVEYNVERVSYVGILYFDGSDIQVIESNVICLFGYMGFNPSHTNTVILSRSARTYNRYEGKKSFSISQGADNIGYVASQNGKVEYSELSKLHVASTNIQPSTEYMIGVSWNDIDGWTMVMNGTEVTNKSTIEFIMSSIYDSDSYIFVGGADPSVYDKSMDGSIKGFMYYDKKLTTNEMNSLYSLGPSLDNNYIGYDNGDGTMTINDESSESSESSSSESSSSEVYDYRGFSNINNPYINKGYSKTKYNNERALYDMTVTEAYNKHGVCLDYYVTSYDKNYDKIWGEDNNRRFVRRFKLQAYYNLPREERLWSKFGIEGIDQFSMYVSKRHFTTASQYNAEQTSKDFSIYIPKVGDYLYSHYNKYIYEIVEVKDEVMMYLLSKQHVWEFIVKPFKDEKIDVTALTSAAPIADFTNKDSDIYDITDDINNKKDNVNYNPPANEDDPLDPFAGW